MKTAYIPFITNPHATEWEAFIPLEETQILRLTFSGEGYLVGSPVIGKKDLLASAGINFESHSKKVDVSDEHVQKFLALKDAYINAQDASAFLGNFIP
jgi:hypothetical protein